LALLFNGKDKKSTIIGSRETDQQYGGEQQYEEQYYEQ